MFQNTLNVHFKRAQKEYIKPKASLFIKTQAVKADEECLVPVS